MAALVSKSTDPRCVCGDLLSEHAPLRRSDGTREDCQDGTVGIGPRLKDGGYGPPKEKVTQPIDPCTVEGCTCGYFEDASQKQADAS